MSEPRPLSRPLAAVLGFLCLPLLDLPAVAKRPPLPSCDGIRFVVPDAQLGGLSGEAEIFTIAGEQAQLGALCPPARVRMRRARKGATLVIAWRQCAPLKGTVRLTAGVDQGCSVLTNVSLRGRGLRAKKHLVANRSACGDGMVDTGNGEACDPPDSPGCTRECALATETPHECGTSSWDTLQSALFARRGCTTSACHGGAGQGGLDLRPAAAYAALVGAASLGSPKRRVEPGDETRSFLWWKLAKGTRSLGDEVPGIAMPDGLPPVSEDELAAVRLWIRAGAPEMGFVSGIDARLGVTCNVEQVPVCGDGVVDPGEECDDGNTVDGDGCNGCALPRCGNGIVDPGETCDDGNQDDEDGCTPSCQVSACDRRITSTWAAIQRGIIDRHGCTEAVCHGGSPGQGNLDLSSEVAYANLVDVASTASPMKRVDPGYRDGSFLWWKLAKATQGLGDEVAGAGMPNGLAPLSEDELEAVRLWIQAGAPEEGVVRGTAELLDTCLPPPEPIKIRPPDPPAADVGIQLHAPPWDLLANSEDEVCFATYFDLSAVVPADQQIDCPPPWPSGKKCFYYNKTELTQDPNSHHSIIHYYRGGYDVSGQNDPNFGPFTCHGGPTPGQTCNPQGVGVAAPDGAECGPGGGCAGRVQSAVACIGYGPPDYTTNLSGGGSANSPTVGGSQQPVSSNVFPPGVYTLLPVSGVMVWNSHAFNLTDTPTTNEQWLNLYFAGPDNRTYQVEQLFDDNDIFVENVPPFQKHEFCRTHTFPKGTRLFQLSSHNHKRGELFRIWGPGITDRCGCGAGTLPGVCRNTGFVHPKDCPAEPGPPLFTSTEYADPTVLYFDPPIALDGNPSSRTYKFCALYDNGADDPAEVKQRSTSPTAPPPFNAALFEPYVGGPCPLTTVACMSGPHQGELCYGDHSACDSAPGLGDGVCDACPVHGGVTTEDEMFILIGLTYRVAVP
jgi:cysteine-rich repeat protein